MGCSDFSDFHFVGLRLEFLSHNGIQIELVVVRMRTTKRVVHNSLFDVPDDYKISWTS